MEENAFLLVREKKNAKACINNSILLCTDRTIFHLYQRGRLQQTLYTTCFFFLFNLNWSNFLCRTQMTQNKRLLIFVFCSRKNQLGIGSWCLLFYFTSSASSIHEVNSPKFARGSPSQSLSKIKQSPIKTSLPTFNACPESNS